MALAIETGAGDGDSFITLAEYEAFQTDYFGAVIEGTVGEQEAALRRAFLYLTTLRWSVDFPTFGGDVPRNVKLAQAILARVEQSEPESLQPSVTPGQQKVLTGVGDISWTYTGAKGADAQRRVVTMAADLLKPYLDGGQTRFLARA